MGVVQRTDGHLEIVDVAEVGEDAILRHDEHAKDPGLAFALYTFANLAPRALSHHRWYRERFPEYPADRKAILPFLL